MNKEERIQKQKARLAELTVMEHKLREEGFLYLGGVDEVGRGPLAGPVVAACVVLPLDFDVLGVDDSKKVTPKKRAELAPIIKERALAYGVGMANEKIIDEINILEATRGAMRVAVEQASAMLRDRIAQDISMVLVDAVHIPDISIPQRALIKGDSNSLAIAAASILAKVTRDDMMVKFDEVYPGYDFASNKGYGTAAHYEGIREHGLCEIHRRSFLKDYL